MSMFQDRTAIFDLAVTQGGLPLDITGGTLYFTAKFNFSDPDSEAVLAKSSLNPTEINISDAAHGIATLTINPKDTLALDAAIRSSSGGQVKLECGLTLKDSSGRVFELDSGTLAVNGPALLWVG